MARIFAGFLNRFLSHRPRIIDESEISRCLGAIHVYFRVSVAVGNHIMSNDDEK